MSSTHYDLIFAGGGLASCLSALRIQAEHPDRRLLIIERAAACGGNHTWSCFATDLEPDDQAWLATLVTHSWQGYEVRFPQYERTLRATYQSLDSRHLQSQVQRRLNSSLRLNSEIAGLTATTVTLADGTVLEASCVVDGRGPAPTPALDLGFQKFTGQLLQLTRPHGCTQPIVMDATVPQEGDYRFFYLLPISEYQVLIEDTRYSNTPGIAQERDRAGIREYAVHLGLSVAGVLREEHGSLPILLGGDLATHARTLSAAPNIGLRATLFHPTTGYSLPLAVRTSRVISDYIAHRAGQPLEAAGLAHQLQRLVLNNWQRGGYLRLLNRMLFLAARPDQRYHVMARFYRLSESLIERFYANRLLWRDRLRILAGRPPVAVHRALAVLAPSAGARIQNHPEPMPGKTR